MAVQTQTQDKKVLVKVYFPTSMTIYVVVSKCLQKRLILNLFTADEEDNWNKITCIYVL